MAEEKKDGWHFGKNLTPNEDGSWYLGKNLDKFGQRITGRDEPRRYTFSDFASLIPGNRIVSYMYDVLRDDPNDPDDYYLGKVMDRMIEKNRAESRGQEQARVQHESRHSGFKQDGSARAEEEFQALQDKASRQGAATGGKMKREEDQLGGLAGTISKSITKKLNKLSSRHDEIELRIAHEELNKTEKKALKKEKKEIEKEIEELVEPFITDEEGSMYVPESSAEKTFKDTDEWIEWSLEQQAEEYYKKQGRTKKAEGGELDDQMNELAISEAPPRVEEQMDEVMEEPTMLPEEEQTMLPDEEMEEDYVDYVVNSTLDEQDKEYLENALMEDAKLSEIFDQVIESATEFSGSGPIEGPGSGMSDSIPARLSDGEFVFTAKAVEEIGADNLQQMMEDAEAVADQRQPAAYGGYMTEMENETVPIQTLGVREARRNIPQVAQTRRQVEEEMLKASPRRFYQPISG